MKHIKQTTKNHTFLLIILLISVISCNHKKEDAKADQNYSKVEKKAVKRVYGYREDSVQIIKNTIKQNQTLSDILSQYRISYQTIHQIALASEEIYSLKKLSSMSGSILIFSKFDLCPNFFEVFSNINLISSGFGLSSVSIHKFIWISIFK